MYHYYKDNLKQQQGSIFQFESSQIKKIKEFKPDSFDDLSLV